MGAGRSRQVTEQEINNSLIAKTLNSTMLNDVQRVFTQAGQSSTNLNSVYIGDISGCRNVTIGDINQNIKQAQDMSIVETQFSDTQISSIITSAVQAAQKATVEQVDNPKFEPFFGDREVEAKQNIVNSVTNEITNNVNINILKETFKTALQQANNKNRTTITNILCAGGDLIIKGINQNIEAIQITKAVGEQISKLIVESGSKAITIQDASGSAKTEQKGLAGIVDSLFKGIGGIVGSIGGIYMVIAIVCVLAVVGVIVVVVMNIGSIGSAVSGVMETGAKTGLIPKGGIGKFGKMKGLTKLPIPKK
jgi:hypothetical protein